jgi:penicillin-binding protein 1A
MRFDTMLMDSDNLLGGLKLPELRMELPAPGRQPAARPAPAASAETPPRNTRTGQTNNLQTETGPIIPDEEFGLELPDYNPLLD